MNNHTVNTSFFETHSELFSIRRPVHVAKTHHRGAGTHCFPNRNHGSQSGPSSAALVLAAAITVGAMVHMHSHTPAVRFRDM